MGVGTVLSDTRKVAVTKMVRRVSTLLDALPDTMVSAMKNEVVRLTAHRDEQGVCSKS
jgi:hypothetical protein